MIRRIKNPISILLSLIMVFSVFAIVPVSVSTNAASVTPKYKITINGKALTNSTTLPYTTTATAMKNKLGYNSYSVTSLKVYKAKDNIGTISGQNFKITKSGSEQLDIYLKSGSKTGHITPTVVCTPLTSCVCEATGYTGYYDGEPHTIEGVTVTSPESGATVKYGTVSGTYNLTAPPTFTDVGTHTVYYQVSASGWVTKTGSVNVNILSDIYTVTWKLDADTEIDTTTVAYGTNPTHANPVKDATDQYTYTFTGWTDDNGGFHSKDETLPEVTGDTTYTATFDATPNEYTVTWKLDADTEIDTTTVAYGTSPTHVNPVKDATNQYTYTFTGWTDGENSYGLTDTLPAVSGNVTYTATFTATPKAVDPVYLVTIPETVDIEANGTATMTITICGRTSDDDVVLPNGKKVNVALTDSANGFNLRSADNETIAYTVNGKSAVADLTTVAECATGKASETITFAKTGETKYSGSYTDTLTFTVSLEDAQ